MPTVAASTVAPPARKRGRPPSPPKEYEHRYLQPVHRLPSNVRHALGPGPYAPGPVPKLPGWEMRICIVCRHLFASRVRNGAYKRVACGLAARCRSNTPEYRRAQGDMARERRWERRERSPVMQETWPAAGRRRRPAGM